MVRRTFLMGWAGASPAAEPLFDGKSLAGWRSPFSELPAEDCWQVRNGVLEAIPAEHVASGLTTDIWTVRTYQAFDLSFEYLAAPEANSGVKFQIVRALYVEKIGDAERELPRFSDRRPGARVIGYSLGLEYQVSDAAEPAGLQRATARAGGLYGKVGPPQGVRPRSGRWNRGRIRLDAKGHLEHWLNGRRTVDTQIGLPLRTSPIALQHHSTRVAFRRILIKVG